ncbi:MAG: T9SS type A sorting domain-containing protein [Candidatus Zixiibacteriota bacterium]|nr:MAG: T9SS type A sorting domain-containing protein [candidate division Zixibacteria bacterium]
MKRITTLSVVFLFLAGIATAATNSGTSEPLPITFDIGGPDAFGYSWEDNDGGGAPVYSWIDITSIGTRVTGLADDNNVGPVGMGFNFPYYWYEVNRMWIGSNGYISFSSNANYAHPFSGIPYYVLPNDLVAILTGDLDFTQGDGECWYYTNSADTFIISYLHVREFGTANSSHTFQCIFSAGDSTIKFQYGPNQGTFLDSNGENRTVIGIENVNGQVGLEYLHDNNPVQRMWHENLAIVFHPDPDPNFVVHDFGIVDGLVDGSAGQFIRLNEPFTVQVNAKNFGNQPEDSLRVLCQIRKNYETVYTHDYWISHLDPGEEQWITYPDPFTPTQDTVYRATFSAILSGDQNSFNNSLTCEIDAYQLPQQIAFCDDIGEDGRSWNGDFSGFAQEFQIPEPVHMTNAYFNVFASNAPGPAYIWVLPDDGNGHPDEGNPLAGDTITITSDGWKSVDFSADNINIAANDKFWIVVLHAFQGTFAFGMDQTFPLSNRGWEYTGGLAPDRDRSLSDVMIKFDAEAQTGIDDENMAPTEFSLSQNYPNPFNAKTNIAFTIENESDVAIGIYNLTGQKVADLSGHFDAGENVVSWDASDAASGVYFYRLSVDDKSQTRKMVLLK